MRISDWSSDVCSSDLDNSREIEGNNPVWLIDDFADAQVAADRTQHVGVDRREAVARSQQVDHLGNRRLRTLKEIAADAGGHLVALQIGRASCRERVCR